MKDLDLKYVDPITGAKISHDCWNNHHVGQTQFRPVCTGWREGNKPCDCFCHDPQESRPSKVSRKQQQAQTMDILETGCGTIEVK